MNRKLLVIDVEAMTQRLLSELTQIRHVAEGADADVARTLSRKVDEYCERVRRRLDAYDEDARRRKKP